jgi:hypothetical protein
VSQCGKIDALDPAQHRVGPSRVHDRGHRIQIQRARRLDTSIASQEHTVKPWRLEPVIKAHGVESEADQPVKARAGR